MTGQRVDYRMQTNTSKDSFETEQYSVVIVIKLLSVTLCTTMLHTQCVTCCLLFKFCMASPGLPCPRPCPERLLLARGSFRLGEGRNGDGGQLSDRTPSWK